MIGDVSMPPEGYYIDIRIYSPPDLQTEQYLGHIECIKEGKSEHDALAYFEQSMRSSHTVSVVVERVVIAIDY